MEPGLADIVITQQLALRQPQPLDREAVNEALRRVAAQIEKGQMELMRGLVDAALQVCNAHTSGVSVLRESPEGEERFYWDALSGEYAKYVGGSTPRAWSPCGTTLDRRVPQLFYRPSRYFTYFKCAEPPAIVEGLVLPVYVNAHPFGTLWIVSHDDERKFNSEDVIVMNSLCSFAGAALALQQRRRETATAAD